MYIGKTKHTPRIGAEVLVDFIEGDMDRPIVVASLYNGTDLPPFAAGVDSGINHAGWISGQDANLRCEAKQPCPREGFWFTPAKVDSRRFFKQGEIMPEVGGDYGATIWQWDAQQD